MTKHPFTFYNDLQNRKYHYYVQWFDSLTLREAESWLGGWIKDRIAHYEDARNSECRRILNKIKLK